MLILYGILLGVRGPGVRPAREQQALSDLLRGRVRPSGRDGGGSLARPLHGFGRLLLNGGCAACSVHGNTMFYACNTWYCTSYLYVKCGCHRLSSVIRKYVDATCLILLRVLRLAPIITPAPVSRDAKRRFFRWPS